jgi:hypothetical protein
MLVVSSCRHRQDRRRSDFNSTAKSKANVYLPLDESAAKLDAYRAWLDNPAVETKGGGNVAITPGEPSPID